MEHPSKGRTRNKVRTYLLYAIGEVLLVMVGILLALQVNNWNENRQLKSQEINYLNLLKDDLVLQLEENERQRTTMKFYLETEDELNAYLARQFQVNEEEVPAVRTALNRLLIGRTLGGYEATYLDLTSSGNLVVISNNELKNSMIQHYQTQKRDRDVTNNNNLNTYKDLWIKLVDSGAMLLKPDFFNMFILDEAPVYDPDLKFLENIFIENLSEDQNMVLIQNVISFKKSAVSLTLNYLDNSDTRIRDLMQAIDTELDTL